MVYPLPSLLSTLNVHPLQHRCNKLKLTLFFKISEHITHVTSSSLQKQYSNLSLRNYSPYNYLVPFCRTSVYLNSFFPSVIKSWNSLPHTIKQPKSLSLLKYYIDSNLCNHFISNLLCHFPPPKKKII